MSEIQIGRGKYARVGYAFDDVAIAPSRRTRDVKDVSTSWKIDAYKFDAPLLAAPMDSVVSPATAIEFGKLGILAPLNLEGLWARYADPEPLYRELAKLDDERATVRLQELHAGAAVDHGLAAERLAEVKASGVTVAAAVSPSATSQLAPLAAAHGAELVIIRGTTVSAEHVSTDSDALNLKHYIYDLDVPVIVGGCATYPAALHLMRTGAAGVLVGFGGGASHTTADVLGVRVPMASAVADVAAARRDYLDESGGRYVHVIADGSMGSSGDVVKAIACGADAAMVGSLFARATDAPGSGHHWGSEAWHAELPRGRRQRLETSGTIAEVLYGPSRRADGSMNIVGALRKAMAITGYSDPKEFQRVEVIVSNG